VFLSQQSLRATLRVISQPPENRENDVKAAILDKLATAGLALIFATASLADDSFRTAEGQIIEPGMTTAEVLETIGPPGQDPDPSDIDIDIGQSVETWTYVLQGSIGGPYLVRIELEGGEVRDVNAEPLD
jgi:hypothetical protein